MPETARNKRLQGRVCGGGARGEDQRRLEESGGTEDSTKPKRGNIRDRNQGRAATGVQGVQNGKHEAGVKRETGQRRQHGWQQGALSRRRRPANDNNMRDNGSTGKQGTAQKGNTTAQRSIKNIKDERQQRHQCINVV